MASLDVGTPQESLILADDVDDVNDDDILLLSSLSSKRKFPERFPPEFCLHKYLLYLIACPTHHIL
jgi:hypothetical protein